jgi:hypothetical protein
MAIPGFNAQHSVYKSASTYISSCGPTFPPSGSSGGADDAHADVSRLQGSWVEMAQTRCDSAKLLRCELQANLALVSCLEACPGSGVGSIGCDSACRKVATAAFRLCASAYGCPSGVCCGHTCCASGQLCSDQATGTCVSCNPLTHTYCRVIDPSGRHTGFCCVGRNVKCCPTGCPCPNNENECPVDGLCPG